jgi:hypothetical protein
MTPPIGPWLDRCQTVRHTSSIAQPCLRGNRLRLLDEALRTECSCPRSKNLSPIAALNIRREAMRRAWCQLRGNPRPQPATNLSQQATITGADLDHRRRTPEYSKLGTERMDWCNFLQVQKYFCGTAIKTAIRVRKRKPPFWAVCKVLILLMLWWTR